ncbi:MAG: EMC3/TMCO1 family protein [Nitrososphaerales archaeon]
MIDNIILQILYQLEYTKPPTSTILVILMALSVNLVSGLARKYLTNVERLRRMNIELKAWRDELRQAISSRDKAKIEKLKKKEKVMAQVQGSLMWENLKPTIFFIIPFFLLWYLMSSLIGLETIVALSPIPIPLIFFTIGPELNLWWWYLIVSFAFSSLIVKLLKVDINP